MKTAYNCTGHPNNFTVIRLKWECLGNHCIRFKKGGWGVISKDSQNPVLRTLPPGFLFRSCALGMPLGANNRRCRTTTKKTKMGNLPAFVGLAT